MRRGVLGRQTNEPVERLDLIPWEGPSIRVELECSEFTSRCPVTGQPDYASIRITYMPRKHLAETKSVKLWLQRWRDREAFNEQIVADIARAFVEQVVPAWVEVQGRFNVRGGIQPTATVRLRPKVRHVGIVGSESPKASERPLDLV